MSEDDKWDSENFRADLQPKSGAMGLVSNHQWDGEDEEEDVKDSWDDPEEEEKDKEDKDEEDEEQIIKAVQVKKPKKLQSKIEEREKKLQEELLEKKLAKERLEMTPEEIHAEKLRQQKLQEASDFEVAKEMLGVKETTTVDTTTTTPLVLETKEDFDKYKDDIVRQLGFSTKNQNFPGFVEQLTQTLCVHLNAADLKKIHTWVGNLQIEKNKMEQGTKTKKKGKGKAKLKIEEDTDIYAYNNDDVYDDFM